MQNYQPNVFLGRDDTFFGVCAALGEDFGFNPFYLRFALGLLLLWNPVAVIGGYAAAGVIVAVSRLLVRNPRLPAAAAEEAAETAPAAAEPVPSAVNEDAEVRAAA